MGLFRYIEPSWQQDLIAPVLSLLVFALSPAIWVTVVIICLLRIVFNLMRGHHDTRRIVQSSAHICAGAVLLLFITTADASHRFAYRTSRIVCEIRKYRSPDAQPGPDHQIRDSPQGKQSVLTPSLEPHVTGPYNYPKLRGGDHEIRLFEIYPDGGRSQYLEDEGHKPKFRGRIIHSNLLWGPSYEAISYTWADEAGDSAEMEDIYIWDQGATISVTRNCVKVLERLRYPKKRRLVWIDAICIDQRSNADRTHQVALMSRIYMSANKVVAYTGEATEESDRLFDWMNSIHLKDLVIPMNSGWADMSDAEGRAWTPGSGRLVAGLENFWYRLGVLSHKASFRCGEVWSALFGSASGQAPNNQATPVSHQQVMEAAAQYFSRRWFQRVWVLQEVSLPDVRRVTIMCGPKSTSAMRALHALSLLPSDSLGALTLGRFYLMIRKKIMRPENSHLLDALIETRDRRCSDPRDKIFGVLSIANGLDEGQFPELVANYNLSTAQVYAMYSRFFMEHHGLAFFWSLIKSSPAVADLPSWSADWSVPWPNYKAVRGRHLPATTRRTDPPDLSVGFESGLDGRDFVKLIRPPVTSGVFTRDGHLDESNSTTVEEVGDLQKGHHLVELLPGVCALLRESGAYFEFVQVIPHHSEVDGLHQVISAWTEYVVDGKSSDSVTVAAYGKDPDYLSNPRTYLIR